MIHLANNLNYYFYNKPVDMRKSFNGLYNIVCNQFSEEVIKPSIFIFQNKRKNCIKLFYWDGDGLAIWYKKLTNGTFHFSVSEDRKVKMSAETLSLILKGIQLDSVKKYRRFSII